jgi:hypothetical protein
MVLVLPLASPGDLPLPQDAWLVFSVRRVPDQSPGAIVLIRVGGVVGLRKGRCDQAQQCRLIE